MDNQEKLKRALDMVKKASHGYRDPDAWKDHVHHFEDGHEYMEYNDSKGVKKAIKRKEGGKDMWKDTEVKKKTVSENSNKYDKFNTSLSTAHKKLKSSGYEKSNDVKDGAWIYTHKDGSKKYISYHNGKEVMREEYKSPKSMEKYNAARQREDEAKPRKQPQATLDALERIKNKTVKESEQLDELSRKTLRSYSYKAANAAWKLEKKGEKEEDKAMSTDGNKYPEKQKKHGQKATEFYNKQYKKQQGIDLAKKKLSESLLDQDQYFKLAEMVIEATLGGTKYKPNVKHTEDQDKIDTLGKYKKIIKRKFKK